MGGEGVWFVPTGEICAWQYLSSGWSTGPGNGCRCTGLGIGQINGLGVGIARRDRSDFWRTCAAPCLAFASCFRRCGEFYCSVLLNDRHPALAFVFFVVCRFLLAIGFFGDFWRCFPWGVGDHRSDCRDTPLAPCLVRGLCHCLVGRLGHAGRAGRCGRQGNGSAFFVQEPGRARRFAACYRSGENNYRSRRYSLFYFIFNDTEWKSFGGRM